MASSRDLASLAAILLSLTALYVCAMASPLNDDEVAALGSSADAVNAPKSAEAHRVRREAKRIYDDLPERGRDRRDRRFYMHGKGSGRDRRARPDWSMPGKDRRARPDWGMPGRDRRAPDWDLPDRGRDRRGGLSVNNDLASLAEMLHDSTKQSKLRKMKSYRDEYGKRADEDDDDDERRD